MEAASPEERPLAGRRILMIAPQPFFQPRGTPISVYHRCVALGRLGARIDLLTYPIGEAVEIEGVTIHRGPGKGLFRTIRIGPSLKKLPLDLGLFLMTVGFLIRNRYDLVHTHEEAGIFYALLSFLFRVPHLYDMHSSLPQQFGNFSFLNIPPVVGTFRLLERLTLKRSGAVITICEDLRRHVEAVDPAKPQVMIENYVDSLTAFGVDEAAERDIAARWSDPERPTVLYVGTLEPYQGLDILIRSAPDVLRRVPNVRFLVVGGSPPQVADLEAQAREAGVAEAFHFVGSVPPQHVAAFVRLADVLVSPRKSGTNTPLKIYSFLRSGRPLVATRLYTHTQVLDDSIAVLTEPEPKAFAEGIVRTLTEPEQVAELVAAAHDRAETRYGYASYLDKVRTACELVLEPRPAGAA
jgi:glycosyltransferase involved in cell wall biosynthesis